MPTAKALTQADAAGLDLVEGAPHAHPLTASRAAVDQALQQHVL